MHNANIETHPMVCVFIEVARRNKSIHVLDRRFHQAEIPPPLRGSLVCQGTGEAMRLRAGRYVESEHYMGRADQPVLVHCMKFDTLAVFQDFWPAYQRDIVIVDDIKARFQNLPDVGRLEERKAGLLGSQRREKAEGALEAMNSYIGVIMM